MILGEVALALLVALLFISLFSGRYRSSNAWGNLVLFFLIIFLAAWAGGVWFAPFGPYWFGVAWIPFVIIGAMTAFLIAASIPPENRISSAGQDSAAPAESRSERAMSGAIWILIAVLVAAIVANYLRGI